MNTEMLRKAVVPASVGVAGISVGGVLGYIFGQRRERRKHLQLVAENEQRMWDEAKQEFAAQQAIRNLPFEKFDIVSVDVPHDIISTERTPYYTVPKVAEILAADRDDPELEELLDHEQEILKQQADYIDAMKPKNIFVDGRIYDASDDDWNWERELNQRSDKQIYVITKDEFDADDMGFRQSSLSFYEGDRRVCDELGEPIYNWTAHIGTEIPFGHGSQDENVVFIRNESLKWEYEVNRDPGRFDVEVGGEDIELAYEQDDLKHSHAPLKMRRE